MRFLTILCVFLAACLEAQPGQVLNLADDASASADVQLQGDKAVPADDFSVKPDVASSVDTQVSVDLGPQLDVTIPNEPECSTGLDCPATGSPCLINLCVDEQCKQVSPCVNEDDVCEDEGLTFSCYESCDKGATSKVLDSWCNDEGGITYLLSHCISGMWYYNDPFEYESECVGGCSNGVCVNDTCLDQTDGTTCAFFFNEGTGGNGGICKEGLCCNEGDDNCQLAYAVCTNHADCGDQVCYYGQCLISVCVPGETDGLSCDVPGANTGVGFCLFGACVPHPDNEDCDGFNEGPYSYCGDDDTLYTFTAYCNVVDLAYIMGPNSQPVGTFCDNGCEASPSSLGYSIPQVQGICRVSDCTDEKNFTACQLKDGTPSQCHFGICSERCDDPGAFKILDSYCEDENSAQYTNSMCILGGMSWWSFPVNSFVECADGCAKGACVNSECLGQSDGETCNFSANGGWLGECFHGACCNAGDVGSTSCQLITAEPVINFTLSSISPSGQLVQGMKQEVLRVDIVHASDMMLSITHVMFMLQSTSPSWLVSLTPASVDLYDENDVKVDQHDECWNTFELSGNVYFQYQGEKCAGTPLMTTMGARTLSVRVDTIGLAENDTVVGKVDNLGFKANDVTMTPNHEYFSLVGGTVGGLPLTGHTLVVP